ncbi:putative transporter [Aspergillus steynii IBT 23096]|uniref:Putative transporter n=1 Tax=Aspergillus steynii IBT 23096 TaxID=1392250 RepID=A0A2I2GCQ0_9EURO|nr:putative transporter [Aspergillus steynii IBT 23096]PLB50651.1 putative transporter [Aspergillus steynii IBT 23096]
MEKTSVVDSPSSADSETQHCDEEKNTAWQMSVDEAQAANINEHTMTVRQALRSYPWAVIWSLIISMSIIMEGYDTNLIGSFYGYPAFQKEFGIEHGDGYQVPQAWQSALGVGGNAGCIVGAFLNGYLIKHYGFRKVFMGALVLMCGFIFVSFFGKSLGVQVAGQVLCGIPWGIFATIGPAYSSELLPMALRSYLTAYTNMCFAIGQFISAGVLQSLLSRDDQWSYRIPYAIQWIWPAPLFFIAIFMPESPWWQVRHGKYEAAQKTVHRLTSRPERTKSREIVAMMIHTDSIERELEAGGSYWDCFRGSNLRRTEIACVTFAGQVFAGSQFAYTGTYFFEQAGMSPSNAYKVGLGGTAVAFVSTILSWFLMKGLGRRTMYLSGMGLMSIYLLIIGFLTLPKHNNNLVWAQSALCIVWLFTFSLTVGPMGWSIAPEVSSTRLRSKTICLARNAYYIAIVVANAIEPYMMNPVAWNWRGKTGFFWFAFAFLTFVWGYFRLAETKGRTFEELDIMFAAGVPTRKFKKCHVDAYAENVAIKDRAKEGPHEKTAIAM